MHVQWVLQPHRLMLCPRDSHKLRVVATFLHCAPAAEFTWTQDVFGNLIATASFAQMAGELVITSGVKVELYAVEWPVFRIAPEAHSYPFDYSADEETDLGALCLPEDQRQGHTPSELGARVRLRYANRHAVAAERH